MCACALVLKTPSRWQLTPRNAAKTARTQCAVATRNCFDGGNLRKCAVNDVNDGVRCVFLRNCNCNMQQPRDKWHSSSRSLSGRLNMRKYISGHRRRRRRRHFLASQCRVSCCGAAKHTHKCAKQQNTSAAAPKPNRIEHKFAKHVPARREPCCGGLTLWESSMAYEIYIYYSQRWTPNHHQQQRQIKKVGQMVRRCVV